MLTDKNFIRLFCFPYNVLSLKCLAIAARSAIFLLRNIDQCMGVSLNDRDKTDWVKDRQTDRQAGSNITYDKLS